VESNPLLDWTEPSIASTCRRAGRPTHRDRRRRARNETLAPAEADWGQGDGETWYERTACRRRRRLPGAEQVAEAETLQDHLLWQLHLSPLSPRDRIIGVTLIEAIDDDGYLREPLETIADITRPESTRSDEILTVLHQVQRFDPVASARRTLGECLRCNWPAAGRHARQATGQTLANGRWSACRRWHAPASRPNSSCDRRSRNGGATAALARSQAGAAGRQHQQ
jgi:RNA polymerase sigma-54 factor